MNSHFKTAGAFAKTFNEPRQNVVGHRHDVAQGTVYRPRLPIIGTD